MLAFHYWVSRQPKHLKKALLSANQRVCNNSHEWTRPQARASPAPFFHVCHLDHTSIMVTQVKVKVLIKAFCVRDARMVITLNCDLETLTDEISKLFMTSGGLDI